MADSGDEDEEEYEEEEQDEYEKDGFIVDEEEEEEPEEEPEESSDEEAKAVKKKKRKKRGEETYELDEDDYDLLQEANVTGFHRPPKADGKTKFKRLKKAGIGGEKGSGGIGLSDDEDEEDGGGRRGRTAEEELKRSLFGEDDGAAAEDVVEEEEMEDEEELGEEDEMADFIVDEEEVDEHGEPSKHRKRKIKRKESRQAPGINSLALQEAQEIFGDVSSLLEERRRRDRDALAGLDDEERADDDDDDDYGRGRKPPPQKLLEKQFEPSLLEEKFLTERDDRLRETDIPERLQILEEAAGALPSSEMAIRQAAEWIYDRAFGHLAVPLRPEFRHLSKDKDLVSRQIANVLHFIHDDKFEIPFIAMYRREECLDLLKEPSDDHEDQERPMIQHYGALWAIQLWDKKWLLLQRRKTALLAAYEKRIPAEIRDDPEKDELVDKIFRALSDAQSEQAVDDCDAKFNLHFPPDEIEVVDGGFKRPSRRSLYSICRKAGLGAVAKEFGLAPDLFGENLQATYKRHDIEDKPISPDELASRFFASRSANEFRDPGSVLRGARHMVAVEINTEPAVREHVRGIYSERAVISTRPTPDGNDAIDTFHQYAGVKWLLNKPINAFDDAQWLLIEKAAEEKLLEVTVSLPKEPIASLMQDCEALYLSDGVSLTAQQWNEQRKQILRDAIVTLLLPAMEKEARLLLTTRAKQWLSAQCGLQLWNKVSIAPYVPQRPVDQDERIEDGPSLRVLACCWGPGNPATTFVMLDAAGEIMNVLHTGYLNMRATSAEQKKRKENDQSRLLHFIREFQPHVCVLGAANLQCRYLKVDIIEEIFKVVEEHPRDLAEGLDMIKVVYEDESISSLYENSRISQEQLPGQPGIVRRAVALGRLLQNPVTMVASLCGPTKEILSLRLHPMQNSLTNEELYEAIERVMVTVVNQVGIDINLAASHDWIFGPLQFVAGLGPRKAGAIQRAIQSAGRVGTRKDLYASIRVMDKKVFINSAGFIRVRGSGQAASGIQHLDPLDDTRIHPESYQMAKNMAEAAFKEEAQQNDDDVDEDMLEMAVEHVMTNPVVLDTMDVEEYARSTLVRGQSKRIPTLKLIKSELQHGFQDWRRPYTEPNEEQAFYMLSGESEETLSFGRIVQATVRNVQQNRVMCVLESGLLGFIEKEDLSDDRNVEPSDKVAEGSIVTCRVKEVKSAKFFVILTCKGSDLRGNHWRPMVQPDPYFQPDNSFLQNEQEKARKKKEEEKKKAFKPRMIVHPYFQNVSVDDAIKALAEKDVGDFIIRPSSRGPTHLSMTLKIHDGVFTHIDIVEGGKESRDLTSFLSLGKTLTIGEESYEDLDEVIARYVEPLVGFLREMLRYRKYKQGTKMEIDDLLRVERAANPKRIPYYFSVAHEHPGAFMLSYIRAVNPHHEYISLSSKGFRYRKHNFDNIDKLVAYFQKHFNDPIPEAPRRAVAAMVPPRSPSSYSAGSYGYSAGSRRPSDSGVSGYDSRNSWGDVGGNPRGGGVGWRVGDNSWSGRGTGSSGWDKGGGRPIQVNGGGSSSWGSEPSSGNGWDKSGGSARSGWDNPQPGSSSQGPSQGGAWESVTNSEVARDGWNDVPSDAPASSGSGWDSIPGGVHTGPRVY